jgi:hypothetical protein
MSANILSTKTHLELVNLVLLSAADQPVRTVNETVASKRASVAIQRAVQDILALGSWSFSRKVSPPSAWDDVTRTVEHTLTQVESVWYEGRTLTFVDWQDHAVAEYTDGEPHYWTQVNYDTLILAPYPTDVEQQSKVRVVGYSYPVPMVVDADTPGLPTSFIDALVSRATGAFIHIFSDGAFRVGECYMN